MKKNKLNILIVIIFSIFLTSCQTAKEVFGGKKRSEQGDEFLVEKKNPLARRRDYDKLPTPGNEKVSHIIPTFCVTPSPVFCCIIGANILPL